MNPDGLSFSQTKLATFPAFLKVQNQTILVVGSGKQAFDKVRLLEETSAIILAIAPDPEADFYHYLQKQQRIDGQVQWIDQPFTPAMLQGAILIFAASGNRILDQAVVEAARHAHIFVNVVDCPDLCDFFTPALINRAPVAIAIGSEGTGPVLTQLIRTYIDTLLSPHIGKLSQFSNKIRKTIGQTISNPYRRRQFWHMVFSGGITQSREDLSCFSPDPLIQYFTQLSSVPPPSVTFLYAGHQHKDWLTVGDQRALILSDTIIHDHTIAKPILTMARRDATFIAVTSPPSITVHQIKHHYQQGQQILRLITDETRLREEYQRLHQQQINCSILPFISPSYHHIMIETAMSSKEKFYAA